MQITAAITEISFLGHNSIIIKDKKYVLWNAGICPIASNVGQVTLATPPFKKAIYRILKLAHMSCTFGGILSSVRWNMPMYTSTNV